jgi:hypothetical protein
MRAAQIVIIVSLASLAGCKKASSSSGAASAEAVPSIAGCDHDFRANAVAKHSWPYPAEARDLRWGDHYKKNRLRLKPTGAAFVTATVTWKSGELIEVEDSEIRITKPRRLVAKRDLFVTRKVWDQGIEVDRTFLAAAKGKIGSFLFYNSKEMCMVDTSGGPGWTPCTLDDAFEGLSVEQPFACEQIWWVKVRKTKVDRGWMPVDQDFIERVFPNAEAK